MGRQGICTKIMITALFVLISLHYGGIVYASNGDQLPCCLTLESRGPEWLANYLLSAPPSSFAILC